MFAPFEHPPERDMANVPPYLPANSDELSPAARQIWGTLMVAVGTGVLLNVLFRLIFDLEDHVTNHLLLADSFSFIAAIFFYLCAVSIYFRGVILSSVLLLGGILMVIVAHLLG